MMSDKLIFFLNSQQHTLLTFIELSTSLNSKKEILHVVFNGNLMTH